MGHYEFFFFSKDYEMLYKIFGKQCMSISDLTSRGGIDLGLRCLFGHVRPNTSNAFI